MPEIALDDLRALIREEVRKPRQPQSARNRRFAMFACSPDELTAIRAAATARGLCVADFLRECVEPAVQCELPRNRTIPINLVSHPSKRTRDKTKPELVDAMRQGIVASRILAQSGAAVRQTTGVPVPKLRGPQRPE